MDTFHKQFQSNIQLIDHLMWPLNQNFLHSVKPKSILGWFGHLWPIWYGCTWIVVYMYLIGAHGKQAGIEMVSQQIWCVMAVIQMEAKIINGLFQKKKLLELFEWCEHCYTMDYRSEYARVVRDMFTKTDGHITWCIRLSTGFILMGTSTYLFQPIIMRVRETPTQVSLNGNNDWPDHIFFLLYLGQFTHGVCAGLGMTSYDSAFIMCIMSMAYRFRTLTQMLTLLDYTGTRNDQKDRQILDDIYKMHIDVLEATSLFRSYYFLYGLVQLGSNLLANCSVLFILQTNGMDFLSTCVFVGSSMQVLIPCAFGQFLQSEAGFFNDALYEINWMDMSETNKKRVLMLITGSQRVVNIRAGGSYELNLGLFAQVMKAGASLCAVMQAM